MRKFSLRVGINENIDNLITDINNQKNIAGSGINNAQRIMSLSDSNQILVGSSVFEKLSQREKYMNCFTRFNTIITHNISITVYHYKNEKLNYINNEVPSIFKQKEVLEKKITRLAAYYMAYSLINEDFSAKNLLVVKVPIHS